MSIRPSRCISLRNMITRQTMPTVWSPSVSHLTLIFSSFSIFLRCPLLDFFTFALLYLLHLLVRPIVQVLLLPPWKLLIFLQSLLAILDNWQQRPNNRVVRASVNLMVQKYIQTENEEWKIMKNAPLSLENPVYRLKTGTISNPSLHLLKNKNQTSLQIKYIHLLCRSDTLHCVDDWCCALLTPPIIAWLASN